MLNLKAEINDFVKLIWFVCIFISSINDVRYIKKYVIKIENGDQCFLKW